MPSVRVLVLASLLLVTSLTISPAAASASVRCRDQEGREVDWWILYKLPRRNTRKLSGHKHRKHGGHRFESNLREGVAYAYLTSAMPDHEWTLSPLPISDPASMPGLTLSQLYSGQEEVVKIFAVSDEKYLFQFLAGVGDVQRREAARADLLHGRAHEGRGSGRGGGRGVAHPLRAALPALP